MEGLGNGSRATYLALSKGKIEIKVQEGTPNAVSRTTTEGKVNHYLQFQNLTGTITGFSTREKDFAGKKSTELVIAIRSGSTDYLLPIDMASGYYRALCMQIFNEGLDLTKPISFAPTYKEEGDKKQSGLFINQNGKGVEKFMYTRENPLDAPAIEEIKNKAGVRIAFDSSLRDAFFANKFNELNSKLLSGSAAALMEAPAEDTIPETGESDDLPF